MPQDEEETEVFVFGRSNMPKFQGVLVDLEVALNPCHVVCHLCVDASRDKIVKILAFATSKELLWVLHGQVNERHAL